MGLFMTGLEVSYLYPLILGLALESANGSTDRASALASLASGIAILSLPLILERLADAAGIRPAYGVIILLLIAAFLITQGTAYFAAHPRAAGAVKAGLCTGIRWNY